MLIHIAVMDYSSGSIKMYSPEVESSDNFDVENWLNDNTDYKDSQCYYMSSSEEIEVEYINTNN